MLRPSPGAVNCCVRPTLPGVSWDGRSNLSPPGVDHRLTTGVADASPAAGAASCGTSGGVVIGLRDPGPGLSLSGWLAWC